MKLDESRLHPPLPPLAHPTTSYSPGFGYWPCSMLPGSTMIFNPATGKIFIIWLTKITLYFIRGGWHGWANKWVRGWPLWAHFKDFFPIKMVKTADLDPQRFEQANLQNSAVNFEHKV